MRKATTVLIVMLLIITGAYADIKISGDARVRPRMDVKDYGDFGSKGDKITDNYYLYRARLLVAADIGSGYYFKTRLGTNGTAYWTGKFGTGAVPVEDTSSPGAGRGTLSFMELYFGHKGESFCWSAGILPIASNPLLDFHYYSDIILDIPWTIYNNNAAHGFNFNYKLGGNKLGVHILVDNNIGKVVNHDSFSAATMIETTEGYIINQETGVIEYFVKHDTTVTSSKASEAKDSYTLDVRYPVSFAGMKLTPEFMMTIAGEKQTAPMTYGAELSLPKIAGFATSVFGGMSSQQVEETETYSGWVARAKIVGKVGPGKLTAWYDIANTSHDAFGDEDAYDTSFSYLWLSYTYTLYKSDKGSVSFAPTYRLYTKSTADVEDYKRVKMELTTQITF